MKTAPLDAKLAWASLGVGLGAIVGSRNGSGHDAFYLAMVAFAVVAILLPAAYRRAMRIVAGKWERCAQCGGDALPRANTKHVVDGYGEPIPDDMAISVCGQCGDVYYPIGFFDELERRGVLPLPVHFAPPDRLVTACGNMLTPEKRFRWSDDRRPIRGCALCEAAAQVPPGSAIETFHRVASHEMTPEAGALRLEKLRAEERR